MQLENHRQVLLCLHIIGDMKRIELKRIIADKNPNLAKYLPGFIIKLTEKIICAKKINYVLDNYSHLDPIQFTKATLDYIGVTYTLHGTDNLKNIDRVIFASNHPLGGLDGLILAHGIAQERPDLNIKLIVNDILMNLEPLRPIFIPVNKHGFQGSDYLKSQQKLYDSKSSIITFPAGLCSRLINGKITDIPWKVSYITRALKSNRAIIPTFVDANNSKSFYRIASLRKRLGIKANLEMVLLPKEMFAQKGKHIDIYFGEPIILESMSCNSVKEINNIIRERAYSLRGY